MKKNTCYLRADLEQVWDCSRVFQTVASIDGDIYRNKEGRRTLRFTLAGHSYFLKYHRGVGWLEIFKNLLAFRLPIISARNEWQAIQHLQALNIDTMSLAAYGERGFSPATRESFVVTDELTQTVSLEHLGRQWHQRAPSVATKRSLLNKLADISAQMHKSGMNHRDYYLCHFLVDKSFAVENRYQSSMPLYLIDLHRAQIRSKIPARWLIKDIGSLYFSAQQVPLSRRDLFRFMCRYSGLSLRENLSGSQARFWAMVAQRAERLRAQ